LILGLGLCKTNVKHLNKSEKYAKTGKCCKTWKNLKNNLQKYVKTSDKYGKLKKGASNHDLL